MKITFKNLGPLESTTLDLSKDLIVLTGPNNTGKTFAAYGLYGYYSLFYIVGTDEVPKNRYLDELREKGTSTISDFNGYMVECANITNKLFISKLGYIFAQGQLPDKNTTIEVASFIRPLSELNLPFEREFSSDEGKIILEMSTKDNQLYSFIRDEKGKFITAGENPHFYRFLNKFLTTVQRANIIIFPVERLAANILQKESKKALKNPVERDYTIPRYPLPIQDYLDFMDDLAELSKQESEFADLADWLEKEILKGKVSTSAYGALQYRPTGSKKTYGVQHTASIVKSLAGIAFYFRHLARKGETIIIDEPELNLHPDNQRVMAKFLAKAVNRGIKVVISTHSSYMIREFNNLIMLNSGKDKAKKLMKEYHYKEDELLDFNKIGAYLFTGNTSEEIPVDNLGFDVRTIDEAINNLNNTSQSIYQTLFDL